MGAEQPGFSILCANVSGARLLHGRLAPSEVEHAVGRCEKRIRNAVQSFGGKVVRRGRDRVIALFPKSEDALQSAIEIQRRVAALPRYSGIALGVGIGVCGGHGRDEMRFFEGEGSNAATSLSDFAHPRQVLFSMPKRLGMLPWMPLVTHGLPSLSLSCGRRRLGVFELDWQKYDPFSLRVMISSSIGNGLMHVRHNETGIVLDAHRPLLTIGRHADCNICLLDPRCSRQHARIERRSDRFVVVDRSTNGTFVTIEGEPEHFIRNHEMPLRGRGWLSFSGPSAEAGAELLYFEVARTVDNVSANDERMN